MFRDGLRRLERYARSLPGPIHADPPLKWGDLPRGREEYMRSLTELARAPTSLVDPDELTKALDSQGLWEREEEWRISTYTTLRIERAEESPKLPFRVTVTCEATMTCMCPTIERAIEMAMTFYYLHIDLLYEGPGWPSWTDRQNPRQLRR